MCFDVSDFRLQTTLPYSNGNPRHERPIWIWDRETAGFVWANGEGVKFWSAQSLEDLQARTFDKDHPAWLKVCQVFDGQVDQIDSRIDPATRTVTVRALIDNEAGHLRPGMLMTVELSRDQRSSPAIPGSSIVRFDQQTFVYVIEDREAGPVAVRRDIELGLRVAGMVEVRRGLEVGDRIVAEGVHRVREGGALQIANASAPGGARGIEIQSGEAAQ